MKKITPLTTEQKNELRGLFYWFFELQWALYDKDEEEIARCRKNVEYNIECCDKVGVPWAYQNRIFCNTTRYSSFDDFVTI